MRILFRYSYEQRGNFRHMKVEFNDGAVTVTEPGGDVYRMTYADGKLTGSRLAAMHRNPIAAHIVANLAASEAGI